MPISNEDDIGSTLLKLTDSFIKMLKTALNNQIDEFLEDLNSINLEAFTDLGIEMIIKKWEDKKIANIE